MKKFLLSPFFAGLFVVFCLAIYYGVCYLFRAHYGVFDIEKIGVTEVLTYVFYGFAGGVAICLGADYLNSPRKSTYLTLLFLWFVALLREMGIQHWIAINDTTAIKINYFKNPNVPLYGKIISACIIGAVLFAVLYLLIKYTKKIIVGLWKYQTIYWTVATFGILGLLTQLADRFPSKYNKITGTPLEEPARFALKIFEEGGESLLPLIFAIGLIQFHLILRKTTYQIGDEPINTVQDSV